MRILSVSKANSAAAEYQPEGHSLNIFKGCQHACKYCYAAATIRKTREQYFSDPDMKSDPVNKLAKDMKSKSVKPGERIFLSFLGDTYQPAESETQITRQCLELIKQHGHPFTVLTKGGTRATRDFDLYRPGDVFGTTLLFCDQQTADEWEPGAATLNDRIDAIQQARTLGIETWISVEPVIEPVQALAVIQDLNSIVDRWSIGKINKMPEIEKRIDWPGFYSAAVKLLDKLGARYQIKNDLLKAAQRN